MCLSAAIPLNTEMKGEASSANCTGSRPVSRRRTSWSMSSCMRDPPTRIRARSPRASARARCFNQRGSESNTLGLKPASARPTSIAVTQRSSAVEAVHRMRSHARRGRRGRRWLELEVDESIFISAGTEEYAYQAAGHDGGLQAGPQSREPRFERAIPLGEMPVEHRSDARVQRQFGDEIQAQAVIRTEQGMDQLQGCSYAMGAEGDPGEGHH